MWSCQTQKEAQLSPCIACLRGLEIVWLAIAFEGVLATLKWSLCHTSKLLARIVTFNTAHSLVCRRCCTCFPRFRRRNLISCSYVRPLIHVFVYCRTPYPLLFTRWLTKNQTRRKLRYAGRSHFPFFPFFFLSLRIKTLAPSNTSELLVVLTERREGLVDDATSRCCEENHIMCLHATLVGFFCIHFECSKQLLGTFVLF